MTRVLIVTGLNRPWGSLCPNPRAPSPCSGATCWSFNGPEPGGPELTMRVKKVKRLIFPGLHSQLPHSRESARTREREGERERARERKKERKKKKKETWGPKL